MVQSSLWYREFLLLLQRPIILPVEGVNVGSVAPMVDASAQERGRQMVAADQEALNPED